MKMPENVLSHWHQPMDDFQTSALEFYTAVEGGLKRREVPDISTARVEYNEGGVLTAKREYLRVRRGKLVFDICAAPYGTSYFFSWWMAREPVRFAGLWGCGLLVVYLMIVGVLVTKFGLLKGGALALVVGLLGLLGLSGIVREGGEVIEETILAMPVIGRLYGFLFASVTYYKLDTILMFQESVRAAVLEVIDELRSQKGLRALSPEERRPTLRDLAR